MPDAHEAARVSEGLAVSVGARFFVGIVFSILGASFIATTAVLIYEFHQTEWFSLAAFYSHLFVFFPTFGLVALAAFYIPACIFTDMYWKHIAHGRLRFLIGFAVVVAASLGLSYMLLQGEERTLWEVTPRTLKSDVGFPPRCNVVSKNCDRLPVLQALSDVRETSQHRNGLSKFGRNCEPDPLIELPAEATALRQCFITGTKLNAENCCKAQKLFSDHMTASYRNGANQSLTAKVHNSLLPLKVFFLLVLLVVGALLAIRRVGVDRYYGPWSTRIETGVLTGAAVMLFWPIMNHAFLESAAVLYGTDGDSLFRLLGPGFSVVFGAWGLLLLLFFYRRYEKSIEAVGKIAGLLASAIAVLQYDHIVDYSVRVAGSGASKYTIGLLMLFGLVALVQLMKRIWSRDGSGIGEDPLTSEPVAAEQAAREKSPIMGTDGTRGGDPGPKRSGITSLG
ncbi:MAG: hypothetical protein ACR2O4_03050 [Hyphomicrobiaceae bacterium]